MVRVEVGLHVSPADRVHDLVPNKNSWQLWSWPGPTGPEQLVGNRVVDSRQLQTPEPSIGVLNEMPAAGDDPGAVGLEVGL